MTATLQLALPGLDPRRDDLTEAEQAAHEAAAACQDDRRAALARPGADLPLRPARLGRGHRGPLLAMREKRVGPCPSRS
jgi:hypothetical protein